MNCKRNLICILSLVVLLSAFSSCGKKADSNEATGITSVLNPVETTVASAVTETVTSEQETSGGTKSPATTVKKADEKKPTTSKKETSSPTAQAESTSSKYNRTGTMSFSDSADNKYLNAVVQKYGVDASLLAAIYTVPDANGNMVLRFDGTKDKNGKLIRNADTLIAIYTVKKDLTCKCASEDKSISEYSANEAKVIFLTTEKYILPQYESQLG